MSALNLTTPDVNVWDPEDCGACAKIKNEPCDFHQGVAHGEFLFRLQIEAAMDSDEFLPSAERVIKELTG